MRIRKTGSKDFVTANVLVAVYCLLLVTCCLSLVLAEEDFFVKIESPLIFREANQSQGSFIKLSGKTNLPDRTILVITAHYTDGTKKHLIDLKKASVENQNYEITFGPFEGKLPAGTYVFIVQFNPTKQLKEVRGKLPDSVKAIEETISTAVGEADDIAQERKEMVETVRDSIQEICLSYANLKVKFKTAVALVEFAPANQRFAQLTDWQKWRDEYLKQINTIKKKIDSQDPLGVFVTVQAGKSEAEKIINHLQGLIGLCDEALQSKERTSSKLYEEVTFQMDAFQRQLEHTLDIVGIRQPKDAVVLRQSLKELETLLNALPDTARENLKDSNRYAEWIMETRQSTGRLILGIMTQLPEREYQRVQKITQILVKIEEVLKGLTQDTEKGLVHLNSLKNQAINSLNDIREIYLK